MNSNRRKLFACSPAERLGRGVFVREKKKKKETEKRRKTRTGKRNDFLCYARAVRCNKKQEQKKETVFAMKPERKIG